MGIFDRFLGNKAKATATKTDKPAADLSVTSSDDVQLAANATRAATNSSQSRDTTPAGRSEPTSVFARLRQGLRKTTQLLNTDVRDLFKHEGQFVDDAFLASLYDLLVRTDMGTAPAQHIRDEVQNEFRGRVVKMDDVLGHIKAQLLVLTAQAEQPISFAASGPTIIMVVGVNGSGKTTSIAKLTRMLIGQGKSVVLGAGDTFRAAAVEQLTIWASRLGAEIVTGKAQSDPASVAHRAVAHTIESGADVCILDTAGRLQTQSNLMDELAKIRRVVTKLIDDAPHEVLLVLDATAGQNAISQAKGFSAAAQCTGIVLAKLDGTAKGGVVIPIRQQFNIPVKYIGIGEQPEDFALFDPQTFVDALFSDQP